MSQKGDAGMVPGSCGVRGSGLSAGPVPGSPGGPSLSFPHGRMLPNRAGIPPTTPPLGRLSSLRTRDLTLGGVFKKPKKTIEPNVHAVRKSKEEFKEAVRVPPKKERRERDERRRESRGRRKEKPQTIQSHSIFEQGPASIVRKSGWSVDADQRYSSTSPLCKTVKKEREASEEREDDILRKLQRDDFIDDPGLRNDAELKPIQLPLSKSTTIKAPPSSSPERLVSQSSEGPGRTDSLVHLLQDLKMSGREELFFMQLPDCMPVDRGSASQAKEEKCVKKEIKATHKRAEPTQTQSSVKERSLAMSEFSEGLLGKLQIRRSGKVELKLGDIILDVTEGAAFSFLQQLVSVQLSEGKTGDMMVLGNVQHKLVLSPDFQALLAQTVTQQQIS
ncbi:DNA-directed RNA polymerase III subunit RPC4 [Neosynchiropus ocellatus]